MKIEKIETLVINGNEVKDTGKVIAGFKVYVNIVNDEEYRQDIMFYLVDTNGGVVGELRADITEIAYDEHNLDWKVEVF